MSLIRTEPLTAIGLAYVSDASFTRNPFSMAHRQVWRDWPVLSDPTFPAYIRTLHFNNDTAARHDLILHGSRQARMGSDAPALQSAVAAALEEEFPHLDLATLDGTLQALAGITCMADLPPVQVRGSAIKPSDATVLAPDQPARRTRPSGPDLNGDVQPIGQSPGRQSARRAAWFRHDSRHAVFVQLTPKVARASLQKLPASVQFNRASRRSGA